MEFLIILGNGYLLGGVIILFYILYWIMFGRFQRSRQFDGPAIVPLFGHYKDLQRHNFQLHLLIDEYYNKFGKLFSFHYQNTELKVVSESKMIHEILVKRFDKFCNRKFFIDLPWPCHQLITMIRGPKWKYIRNLLSSLMTTVSLKKTFSHFNNAATTYADKFSKAAGDSETVDLVSHSQGYLMEILLSMAFSIDCPNQSDFNAMFVELSSKFINPPSWVGKVAALPFGNKLVKYLPCACKNQLQPFIDIATKIVAERTISTEKKEDILQTLLEFQKNGPSKKGDILNNEDILAQGIAILTAVHSQTSTTLAFITYYLAKNLDVQKKVQQEIDNISNDLGFPNLGHLTSNLQYMDSVIKEVLRLHPPSFVLTRECTKTNTINGIEFKEGDAIAIPIYSIQRDNEIWEDPYTFNPERFDGNEKPNTFYAHGMGPRMCVGPRMARLEIKTALCKLLRKHTILLQNQNQKLSIRTNFTVQATTTLTAPIYVNVHRR